MCPPTYEAYSPADVGVEITACGVDVGLGLCGRRPPGQIAVQNGLSYQDLRTDTDAEWIGGIEDQLNLPCGSVEWIRYITGSLTSAVYHEILF